MKLLLIGPASLGIAGGISVSFHHLHNSLLQRSTALIEVVDTVGIRQRKLMAPFALALFFWRVFRAAHRSDIVTLHAMPTGLPYIGWFIWAVAALWGSPLIYRAFGGGYHDELTGRCRRRLAAWFMRRASVVLLQTKQLMDRAATDTLRQTVWFPTARPMPTRVAPRTGPCRRFVYVGQLKIEKGLEYLARAAAHLPQDAHVDVYGPWYNLPRDTFAGRRGIRYVGELHPDEVVPTLNRYDACVIPTFLRMEGHPGIGTGDVCCRHPDHRDPMEGRARDCEGRRLGNSDRAEKRMADRGSHDAPVRRQRPLLHARAWERRDAVRVLAGTANRSLHRSVS